MGTVIVRDDLVKTASLKTFAPQAQSASAVIEGFHMRALTIDKDKSLSFMDRAVHFIFGQGRQPIELLAHVGGLGIEPDLQIGVLK